MPNSVFSFAGNCHLGLALFLVGAACGGAVPDGAVPDGTTHVEEDDGESSPSRHRPISLAASATPVANVVKPAIQGTLSVGSTIRVDPGTWSGTRPITFAYKYQICSDASSCAVAPGLFAQGPRPTLLLVAGTAGRRLKITVTATNPAGKKSITTALTAPVAAYSSSLPPLIQLVNGLPDNPSMSSRTTFQYQATGSGVTLTCALDGRAPKTCPASKVTYGDLLPGSHTFVVTAKNVNGTTTARHTWNVVALPPPLACPGCYHPAVGATWQWQLNADDGAAGIDPNAPADMYDIDAFNNDAQVVADLKARRGTSTSSRKVTCYFPAGTLENWRDDAERLDPQLLGYTYYGFSDERWIDVRAISKLAPWLEARMDMCKAKGFDAIEYDNVDGWSPANGTGLNITAEDEVAFIVYLANAAHARGLSMAHKSNVEQIPQIRSYVDFAVVEECFAYKECTRSDPNGGGIHGYDMFTEIGKAVFQTEYRTYDPQSNVCARSNSLRFSTIYKHVILDSYRVACWDRSRFP